MPNNEKSDQKSQIPLSSILQKYLKVTLAILIPLFILLIFTHADAIAHVVGNEGIAIAGGLAIGIVLIFVTYAPVAVILGIVSWFVIHQIINHQIHF